jgi:TonB-linked SusC/RagA family outer membrane protein
MNKLLKPKSIKSYLDLLPKIPMVMRITVVLLFCILFQSHAEKLHSQSAKISLNLQNATVEEILNTIEENSEYSFLYNSKLVDVDRKASVSAKDKTINAVLSELFDHSDVQYRVEDKQIVLSNKDTSFANDQQTKKITGSVNDLTGLSVIGASVMVKGTTEGTITDIDGKFTLEVAPDAVIEISYVGYVTQTIQVNGKTSFIIELREDTQKLDEVVVIGYGTQKKVNLTGAITSVKAETLENMPTNNLSNALAGRAPGVTVSGSSGMAGASSSIRMRGSFGEPLYVINNVIKDKSDFDALDPNEVDNISFLKDAASASIYGSKAGNGVVLVTTKSGNKGQKPVFEYKGSYSVSNTTRPLQDYSATDELIYANRVQQTKGFEPIFGSDIFEYFQDKSYNVNDYIWQNPTAKQHNISVNGGSDKIQYFMMMGYQDQEGSYKNLDYKRYNFRSDVTANITKRFSVNVNLSGNQRNYDRFYWPFDDVNNFSVPDFYRANFNWTRLYPFFVDESGNPSNNTNDHPVIATAARNPIQIITGDSYQKQMTRTIDGQFRLNLDLSDFVKGLKTSLMAQYTASDFNHKALVLHNKSYRFQSASSTNKFIPAPIDPNNYNMHNLGSAYEKIEEKMEQSGRYQLNWFVNYDRTFGNNTISGLLLYEQAEGLGKKNNGRAEDFLSSSVDQIFATSSDTERRYFNGSEWENARQSIVGRFNYSYASKYIAEFSFRYDGNYKFAPDCRWGFFPSGSAAWRISEENFIKDIEWLSNLKIRASYGSTGDDNQWNGDEIMAFQWREYYKNGDGYVFGDNLNNALSIGNTYNPLISWAKLEVWDIGVDFGFLGNRLSGEIDYFYKYKSDILGSRISSVPGTYGASMAPENYAEQEWNGVDLSLRWSDRIGDVNYTVYGNMGYVKDKWLKWDETEGLEEWRSRIGRPNDRLQGYVSKGIIRTQDELDALPDNFTQFGRKPILGTILFEDIRGENYSEGPDGKIDNNDYTFISDNGIPRINYGLGFNIEWKNFVLDAHFQGVGAYDRLVSTKGDNSVFQVGEKPYFELWTGDNVWTPENPDAKYPRVSGEWMQPEYGGGHSTFWLRNGAYMRLKNLNIAYTLPRHWLTSIGVNRVQLFINGTNLFSLSAFDEHDPEQESLDSYPLMRTFTGGLSVNF